MKIQERINSDIKDAMKSKNIHKLAALRAFKSAIMLESTKYRRVFVSDELSLEILTKLLKQRKDSASIYIEQNRQDLADDELNQLIYLQEYLPKQLEEEELREVVRDAINRLGFCSLSDLGKCMGSLMRELKGKADGSLVRTLVHQELSKM